LNSKFCSECGAKIEPLESTPPKRESFTGVLKIVVGLGTDFTIMPSDTDETIVIVDGPEEVKQGLTMELKSGILEIQGPSDPVCISTGNISGCSISIADDIFVGRNLE